MIFGIGTDIVNVQRMSDSLVRHGDRFARRILSTAEYEEFTSQHNQAAFLAKRFAAKEAAVKAMGTGFRHGISLTHISVRHDRLGKPVLAFTDAAKKIMQENKVSASYLSIADEKDFALAYVVLESD